MNILQAVADPKVFKPYFRGNTWTMWLAFLAALFALPMTPEQLAIYQKCTGRTTPPISPSTQAWLVIGRRGGKSFILATIAVFLACFFDWRPYLGPGERATIMIIAADRRQARVIKRFCSGLLRGVPMLKTTIEDETKEIIELANNVSIEIHTASFRSTRGYTIVAALCDEIAFWPTDETSSEPDIEVITALEPGMATVPGAIMLCASSPYARKGALWDTYRNHFGKDGDDILVWQATTREMNPGVPQRFIDRKYAEDPARAAAEYGAQFRTDLEQFVSREVVEASTSVGVYERSPQRGVHYFGFMDPAGGSGRDLMTASVGHVGFGTKILTIDAMREAKPPFSPQQVAAEFSDLFKSYNINHVMSDKTGLDWCVEAFAHFGITCEQSARPKTQLYTNFLPLLNSRRVELLDHQRCNAQLLALERTPTKIDHPDGGHDDLINAVAGVADMSINYYGGFDPTFSWVSGSDADKKNDDPDGSRAFQARRYFEYIQSHMNGGGPLYAAPRQWTWT